MRKALLCIWVDTYSARKNLKGGIAMKKLMVVGALVVIAVSGCAGTGHIGGSWVPGGIYSDVLLPVAAEGQAGDKEGQACATSILGWFASGDASVKTAMVAGGIKEVSSIDVKVDNTLGIYAKYCTTVRGK
jgi:hypothetical protein